MADWRKSFEIVWHSDVPAGVEAKVREDIADELDALAKPSDLVFHTVFLGDSMEDGASVIVWGAKRDRRFHAEYCPTTEWVTLSEATAGLDAALSQEEGK